MGKVKATAENGKETQESQALSLPEIETLRGDIRDEILREFKAIPKPWQKMNEKEQQRLIDRAEQTARELVSRSTFLIAHKGFSNLMCSVLQWTVKDGIKIVINASDHSDNIMKLAKHNSAVVLVLADPQAFMGEKAKAEPENVGDLAIPKNGNGGLRIEDEVAISDAH